jgi:hypothetical protein
MKAGRLSAVVIALMLGLGPSLALAQQAPQPEPKAASKGLVVFVDPVTGKIRQPDAGEIGALVALPAAAGTSAPLVEKPLVMKYGPAGAVGVVLDSRFETFMVATKGPDGKLSTDCVDGKRKAEEAVAAAAPHAATALKSEGTQGKEAADVR